jgi:uncharacterized metal-binding protein
LIKRCSTASGNGAAGKSMPSGRTHDAITILLAVPAFAAAFAATKSVTAAAVVAAAFIVGGVMFGPDLDTVSRQYSRWGIFRGIWFPYRSFFKHRSRFSHGLVFGALFRTIYFMGILTLVVYLGVFAYAWLAAADRRACLDIALVWQPFGECTRRGLGDNFFAPDVYRSMVGAASHTFTDMAGSFVKTGGSQTFSRSSLYRPSSTCTA